MSNHAKLSPSGSKRWMNCPGSLILERGFEDEKREASAEGTFAHDIAAQCLEKGRKAFHALGVKGTVEGFDFQVDEEMAQHIQTYLNVVNNLCAQATDPTLYVEKEVHLFPNLWGTADAIVIDGDTWHICDLKFGAGVHVEVKDNSQLMVYALCAWNQLRKKHPEPKTIYIHIVQPRHHQGGHTFQKWALSDLMDWLESDLAPAVLAAESGSDKLKAGDWCQFCKAASSCPEIHRSAIETAKSVFSEAPALVNQVSGPIRPEDLTPEQLGQILEVLPQVEAWMKNLRKNAFDRAVSGQPVPGFKLVRTSPHRRWINPKDAFAAVARMHDNPEELITLKSPAQVEKILGKPGKDVVASLVEKPEGQLTLAPQTDRRKAATSQPTFQPIDADETDETNDV